VAAIELLTPDEVGELLRLSANRVVVLARRGEIPFLTIDGHVRFDAKDIEDWLRYPAKRRTHPARKTRRCYDSRRGNEMIKPSITEVVGQHVHLHKTGKEYVGRCPFHEDKTPSFSVNEAKGLFYCFGCGESGDVFDFIMRLDGLTFPEAKRALGIESDSRRSTPRVSPHRKAATLLVAWLNEQHLLIGARCRDLSRQIALADEGRVVDYEDVLVDEGVADKRLLLIEEELSQALKVMGRDGNILSAIVRQAWDSGNLHPLTKSNPIRATGAHISIIGHITHEELLRYLTETEQANGFANRFIWLMVRSAFLTLLGFRMKSFPR